VRQLLVHEAPVCPELRGESSKRRRSFARDGTQMRHDTCQVIQDEPHGDRVHRVDAAAIAIVELSGNTLNAVQANSVQVLREVARRCLAVRTSITQDSSQLREASRGVVHRA